MGGSTRLRLWVTAAVVALVVVGVGAYAALSTWGAVNRVAIERPSGAPVVEAAEAPEPQGDESGDPSSDGDVTVPPSGDGLDVFLLVGSDSRAALDDLEGFGSFGGSRADVVMVLIRPRSGSSAAILSLPRDLLVADVCGGSDAKLGEALEGCGSELNGPSALLATAETLIGIPIDHFAMVDLAGFQHVVDAVGGYEICLDRAVRDRKSSLDLPAGCTLADGEQTLAWLRSRSTQELTEDGWRYVPGASDLIRNQRQRDFMIDMMGRLSDLGSPQDIAAAARTVAPFVTVDSGLSLVDAIGLAWTMRGVDDSVYQIEVPVVDATTDTGAAVVVPTADISRLVSDFLTGLVNGMGTGQAG